MSEKIFKIAGMDCAEETNALRQAVGALPGILDLRFNLLDGAMTVTAPEGAVDERDIVAAMERAGMSARPVDNTQAGASQSGAAGSPPTSPVTEPVWPVWLIVPLVPPPPPLIEPVARIVASSHRYPKPRAGPISKRSLRKTATRE